MTPQIQRSSMHIKRSGKGNLGVSFDIMDDNIESLRGRHTVKQIGETASNNKQSR